MYDCYVVFDEDSSYSEEDKKWWEDSISNRILPDLLDFVKGAEPKDIEIFNDCGDELTICKSLGYRCVGTRYNDKGTADWQKAVDYANRHLTNDPMNKKWYDPDQYKNYEFYRKLTSE